MKKDVWKYGLASGLILAAAMGIAMLFEHTRHVRESVSMAVGYTLMVLSFLVVFVGVKHYRDTERGGYISFGRALSVGLLMTLISSACYVLMWEAMTATVEKNFAHDYAAGMITRAEKSGLQGAALDRKVAEARQFEASYANPVYRMSMTLMEPLPVGIVMALVSAGILRRRRDEVSAAAVGAIDPQRG